MHRGDLAPAVSGRARLAPDRGHRHRARPARAKYGLIETNRGDTLIFHLGMSGRWRIDPGRSASMITVLETQHHRLALNDPRRSGLVDLMPSAAVAAPPPLPRSGRSPWGRTSMRRTCAHVRWAGWRSVKALLLDQRVAAGLGNIYVCEALYMARIAPTREGGSISSGAAGEAGRRDLARCWRARSAPAARRSATMPGPMASSAISPRNGGYMAGKGSRAGAEGWSSGASIWGVPLSGARNASRNG